MSAAASGYLYGWTESQLSEIRRQIDPKGVAGYRLHDVAKMLGDPRSERRGQLFDLVDLINELKAKVREPR